GRPALRARATLHTPDRATRANESKRFCTYGQDRDNPKRALPTFREREEQTLRSSGVSDTPHREMPCASHSLQEQTTAGRRQRFGDPLLHQWGQAAEPTNVGFRFRRAQIRLAPPRI